MNKKQAMDSIKSLMKDVEGAKRQEWDLYHDDNWDSMLSSLEELKGFVKKVKP